MTINEWPNDYEHVNGNGKENSNKTNNKNNDNIN